MTTREMPVRTVTVIATGGTIASSNTANGSIPTRGVNEMLQDIDIDGVDIRGRDLLQGGSFLFGHRELRRIADAVAEELATDYVDGVVVTHGTDTMEETGFLLDLVHQSDKPVILTGAQKTADQSDTDGPRNLTDAVRVAASSDARGCGALIVFAGLIHAPQRVRKHHTLALDPYHSSDTGPLGHVIGGTTRLVSRPVRPAPLPMPGPAFDRTRVDVVCCYPGTDATLAEAAVNAGAQAVVIAGTGAGNGNHALVEWTRGATASGVTVGLATRVAEGPVVPIYGNGGGVDLLRAGAVCLGGLPLFHGRLLLAMLIGTGSPVDAATLADYI